MASVISLIISPAWSATIVAPMQKIAQVDMRIHKAWFYIKSRLVVFYRLSKIGYVF